MAVTRKPRHPKRPTQRLVGLLNFNYPARSKEAFLQKEIRRFIFPLLLSKPELVEFHLGRLIGEINRIGLTPHWVFTPAAVASGNLRFGERHLRIQNTEWVVSKISLAHGLRESILLDIMLSMEAGDFGLLRRCPICETVFVAKDFRQELCGSGLCKRKRDNDTARTRVAEYRDRDRKRKAKLNQAGALLADKAKGFERFCDYMKLREKKPLSQGDADQLWAVTRHLSKQSQTPREWDKQIKKGVTLEHLWERFPLSVRSVFLANC